MVKTVLFVQRQCTAVETKNSSKTKNYYGFFRNVGYVVVFVVVVVVLDKVSNDQEMARSERNCHFQNRGGKKLN